MILELTSLAVGHLSSRKGSIGSRGTFIITQKENKGEYGGVSCGSESCVVNPEWKWDTVDSQDIYAHVVDQNGPSGGNSTPYRHISATSFGSNVCTDDYDNSDTLLAKAKGLYGNNNQKISGQISCKPNTLNVGNWYSFPAATAGAPATTGDMPNSICPKGWQLPPSSGNKSYNHLIRDTDTYHITTDNSDAEILASPFSFVRLGYYNYAYGSLNNRGNGGYYWLSTAYSATDSNDMDFHSEYLSPQFGRNRGYGLIIRCISRNSR